MAALRVSLDEIDVVPLGRRPLACPVQQLGNVVEADGVAKTPRGRDCAIAGATGDVQHPLTRQHVDCAAQILADLLHRDADPREVAL